MILKPITIEGKSGTVMYLDALWHPTTPEHATMAKVLFDDGSVSFYTAQQETVEKYDPQQLRDEKGRWAKGAGNLGTTYLHGTAQGFLEDILRNGIRGSEGGKIHPKDKQKRKLALPGHVYMTTDLEEAKEYAQSAGVSDEFFLKNKETVLNPVYAKGYPRVPEYEPSYDAGTEIGGGLPCVITIELPPSVVKKLRKDRRSDILTPDPYAPGGGKRVLSDVARSYKGDIKPEWIKSITYMTRDMATGKEEWHTIDAKDYKKPGPQTPPYLPQPPGWEVSPEWQAYLKDKKVAAEGTVFYIPLRIPLQSIAGLGGITRKFDEVKHPRGEDGRFIEATQPRIFNRPSEIVKDVSWGETSWRWIDKETGKPSGRILTGEPIPRDQIPAKLYHVTTNAPAVESSGVLLGLLESGGLGGGQAEGVSFTSSKEDAVVIQRELMRAVWIARGDVDFDIFEKWARDDERAAGLPEGALAPAVKYMREFVEGNIDTLSGSWVSDPTGEYADENRGKTFGRIGLLAPEEKERLRRSLMKDALNAYLGVREDTAQKITGARVPILKNPILFGRQEQLAKLKVEDIQILEASPEDIPAEALVTTGSDKFLHEVRVYADVPRRRKKVAYDPNQPRGKGGRWVKVVGGGVSYTNTLLYEGQYGQRARRIGLVIDGKEVGHAEYRPEYNQPELAHLEFLGIHDKTMRGKGHGERFYRYVVEQMKKEGFTKVIGQVTSAAVLRLGAKIMGRPNQLDNVIDIVSYEDALKQLSPLAPENEEGVIDTGNYLTAYWKLAYDPNQARGAEGTPEGGQFVETGRSGVATPDPVLAAQAKAGIATIERLLPQAMKMVDAGQVIRKHWDNVDLTTKQAVIQWFVKKFPQIPDAMQVFDTLPEYAKTERMHDYLKEAGLSQIVEYEEPRQWVTGVESGDHSQAGYEASAVLARRLTILRTDELRKERGLLEPKPEDKRAFTIHDDETDPYEIHGTTARFAVRDAYGSVVADAKTLEEAQAAGERWATAAALESFLSSERVIEKVWDAWKHKSSDGLGLSLQLAAARELGGLHRMTPDEVQEAEDYAVQELGNNGMATLQAYVRGQWEVTQFVMSKAGENTVSVYRGLMLEGEKVKATTHVVTDKLGGPPKAPPTNIKLLEQRASPELDTPEKPPLKVFVTFDYDGEHFVEEKKRLPAKSIYDLAPGESPIRYEENEVVIQRRLDRYHKNQATRDLLFTKLPDLQLQRAGAQSTTGSRAVANDWGGVGELPPDPERVVVRIEAPATSVLSLPIYGANTQAEHETVVVGTRDKWLWDAWYDRAPAFESQTITGAPVPKKPLVMEWSNPLGYDDEMVLKDDKTLVIDLQAEDRGKPHWMSSVDWQSIAQKFDEAKHPRHPEGSTEGGRFAESGTSGVATPDPRLVEQAKAGILSVEKLIPEAIQTADYAESLPDVWDDLTPKVQDKVHDKWQSDSYDDVNPDTSSVDNQYWDNLREENQEVLDEAVEETLTVLKEKFPDLDPALVVEGGDGFSLKRTLDPDSLDYGAGDDEDNRVELDWAALRFMNGQPLTEEEQHIVKGVWDIQYGLAFQEAFDARLDDEQYNDDVRSLEQDILDEQWNEMSDRDKMELLERYDIKAVLDPKTDINWVTGVTEGEHGEESYNRTHAVALRLTELRFDELRKERGLLDLQRSYDITETTYQGKPQFVIKDKETGALIGASNTKEQATLNAEEWFKSNKAPEAKQLISTIWQEWKQSSSDGLSLSLQLAAAQELGGHHRMTEAEVQTALTAAFDHGGMATLRAYVRAQWEVTQMVMEKAKQDKISVYRGLMLPGAMVDRTPKVYVRRATGEVVAPTDIKTVTIGEQERVTFEFNGKPFSAQRQVVMASPKEDEYGRQALPAEDDETARLETNEEVVARHLSDYETYIRQAGIEVKLPTLPLKRAGAQSTTGTASVANNWNGVGDLPPDPTRVVLRIEAPSTSVLSLPVYGQNEQAEHETVVVGTTDRWLWDAWHTEAPTYDRLPISRETARKMDKSKRKPLEIDLQALDRGQPHWMSGVDWQTVVKWEESKHPREPKGGPGGGQFTEGVGQGHVQEKTAQPHAGTGGSGGVAVPEKAPAAKGRPDAVEAVQAVADAYNAKHGLPPVEHGYAPLDEARAGTIADAYDALPLDDSGNPEVRAAYAALATEIRQQFDHIVASGVTFTPWTKDGQPYQNSSEMADDIRQNKHMFFFTGGEPNDFMAARDPETGLTVNDMFRAVHDYFGHAAGGYGFGPRGEENAWMSHSQMLTPLARRALTTETRGQNSWVNFGRHNYDAEGNPKDIPPKDRPFATQKTALLPEWYAYLPGESTLKWDESQHPRDKEGQFTEGSDSQRVQDYLRGLCWPFAVALQREYGGKIHVLDDPQYEGEPPLHAVVKTPAGEFMDASGPVTLRELKERYETSPTAKLRPATEAQIHAIDPLKPEEIEEAQKFIRRHGVQKWDEAKHPRDKKGQFAEGQFTRVALTSQRPEGDPEHKPNKEVFRHMREFHEQLAALPGVSHVSVKPGVGGWEGGSESMWQIYYKGNGEARKLVARTAKAFHQDAVLILNKCEGHDCQPAVELSFEGAISPSNREYIHQTMVDNGISGWTWMKRDGKSVLRMVRVPQWEKSGAPPFQPATAAISQELREGGLKNHRKVHKVAVSVMEQEGENSYDSIITES